MCHLNALTVIDDTYECILVGYKVGYFYFFICLQCSQHTETIVHASVYYTSVGLNQYARSHQMW
jgi:hypothetical protein